MRAHIDGFSLHAAARVEAPHRKQLQQLCRTIAQPAPSDERVQLNAAGQLKLKLNASWRDATTKRVMRPLEFMQRLAAQATEGSPSDTLAAPQAAPHPIGVRVTSRRVVSGRQPRKPRRSGTQCQAAPADGAAMDARA
ncbi:MAG: transposase [Curvibacter sp.]